MALDNRFYDRRGRSSTGSRQPVFGTAIGLHQDDDLLGDGSREQVLAELASERAHLTAIERLDPAGLSADALHHFPHAPTCPA
jgi:hypothetical protein